MKNKTCCICKEELKEKGTILYLAEEMDYVVTNVT
jgi:hypothetical protein